MKRLTYETIHQEEFLIQESPRRGRGASLSFFGIVRGENEGRKVTHLIYEANESLAEVMMGDLLGKAARIWPILDAKILHRLGKVEVGQIAVAIEVSSAHRDEAYGASRFLIDEVKSKVPIWKKEYFEGGIYHWGSCERQGPSHPQSFYPSLREMKGPSAERKDIKIFVPEKHHPLSREREYLKEITV